jgi:hypothetical protein
VSRTTADRWTTIAAAVGLSAIGVTLVITRTNHGLLEPVIAAIAGLGGWAIRNWSGSRGA